MHPNQDALNAFHERWSRIAATRRFAPTRSIDYYLAATNAAYSRPRERKWVNTCALLEDHLARFQSFPHREGRRASVTERRLANWVRYQRRSQHQLSGYQRGRLQLLDGWTWEPREERWLDWLTDYEQFVREHNRRPRRNDAAAEESRLAIWYRNQRRAQRVGLLDVERVQLLKDLEKVVKRMSDDPPMKDARH